MFGRFIVGRCKQILVRSAAVNATENWLTTAALKRPVSLLSTPQLISSRKCHHLGPQVQKMAPVFKGTAVINGDFKEIDICDYRGKYLVLFFYPLDFTFVCPTEIIAFSDRIDEFKAINTDVIGVSCDSHFSHLAWINTPRKHGGLGELKYPLLSDFNKSIARDYNVLLEADGVPLRGLFIIDPQGVVRQITVNDLPVGRSVDEVLRLVKAFQFTDKHGEVVCIRPENKGDKEKHSKFSVQNIKPKSSYETREKSVLSVDETAETRDLSIAQLERLVLLDQMKFYKMQLEEHRKKKDQKKKDEKKSVSLLEERDALSV